MAILPERVTTFPPPAAVACLCLVAASCGGRPAAVESAPTTVTALEDASTKAQADLPAGDAPPDAVDLTIFAMSECGYAADMMPDLAELAGILGDLVDIEMVFVMTQHAEDGSFYCMHGEDECKANAIHLCAAAIDPAKYLGMAVCLFEDFENVPSRWRGCATAAGIDPIAVEECASGDQGKALMEESAETTKEQGVSGSPTIQMNGEIYVKGRSTEALLIGVCAAMPEDGRPDFCPAVPSAHLTIITDDRCDVCASKAESFVSKCDKGMFGLETTWLDWSDEKARSLASLLGIALLPAFVFDAGLEDQPAFDSLEPHLSPAGGYWVVAPSYSKAKFDPLAEICGNGEDDSGDGKIDCEDTACAALLECKAEKKGELDVFIMSHCPYAAKAMKMLPPVIAALGGEPSVEIHFITDALTDDEYAAFKHKDWCAKYSDGKWYCSLHGPKETDENIRILCAQDLDPAKAIGFARCRMDDLDDPDWKPCAASAGLDEKKMASCVGGKKGLALLAGSADLCTDLGMHASPTILVNGKHAVEAGAGVASVVEAYCSYNPGAAGCDSPVVPAPAAPDGGKSPSACESAK